MSEDAAQKSPPSAGLNEAQRAVRARLGRQGAEPPTFDVGLRSRLRHQLESALADVAEEFGVDRPLFIGKRQLAGVFGCEVSFLHEEEQEFAWRPQVARGAVAHKAIELGINWRSPDPAPPELVDAALESLARGDSSLGGWLDQCAEVDRAELRGLAINSVAAFFDCWPPLQRRWRPATESSSRVELCGGRIVLGGKTDLTLGRAEGTAADKVIVDLKTGWRQPRAHRDDLRFYALMETVKLGTPPRKLATYYLDSADLDDEEVDEDLLEVALRRTVDGIRRYAELHGHLSPAAEPAKRPGPPCRWCALRGDCAEGQEHLAQADAER
ncbi:MAG: PD-(D/E)XK nuclease family protein [bacterium]|nr:PD-(D/E)XK nuclease family protein [bacterium]